MSEPLVLKSDTPPTIFNKEMVIGTLLLPVFGTIIGAVVGKRRMERENTVGKLVDEKPGFWNMDTLLGGLIGGTVGSLLLALTGPVGLAVEGVLLLGGTIAGAYLGGKAGEKRQEAEYDQARQQTIVRNLSASVSPEVAKAVEYTMAHNKSWSKDVAEQRMLEQSQQRQV